MEFSQSTWDHIQTLRITKFRSALKKDEYKYLKSNGVHEHWQNSDGRIATIRSKGRSLIGPNSVKSLLLQTGWTEDDLVRLGLIKVGQKKPKKTGKSQD